MKPIAIQCAVTGTIRRSHGDLWRLPATRRAASAGVVVVPELDAVKIDLYAPAADDGQLDPRYIVTPTDIAAIPTDGPVTITFGEGAAAATS